MRILEFHPGPYRNLPGLPVYFTLDPAAVPDPQCSIRFLVGRNGTGKTNLLRFLTSIFMALEEDFRRPRADSPAYHIPFRLTYRLRTDMITIQSEGQGRSTVQFTINGSARAPGDLPDRDRILPRALLIYTSGDVAGWQTIFQQTAEQKDEETDNEPLPEALLIDEERPPDWHEVPDPSQPDSENTQRSTVETPTDEGETATLSFRRTLLVEPSQLKSALLAALLDHQVKQAQGKKVNEAFDEILRQDVQVKLLSFSLCVNIETRTLLPAQRTVLSRLYDIATLTLNQWGAQLWVYDLAHIRLDTGHATLIDLAEQISTDPFQFFQVLIDLQKAGIISAVNLILRYQPPNAESAVRTLLAENLSDGEFAFLSRMALIDLLHEDDCLFILDEPETHFNDDWKRNLVDSIERSVMGTTSEVILTSHASITLTDAYPDEVILLSHEGQENVPLTFGAEQGELLRRVYGAERSVGRRAIRIIEDALKNSTDQALEQLLDQVGPGNYRFKIVRELERRAASDQQT